MSGTTSRYQLPFPTPGDPIAHGADQIRELANKVETELQRIETAPLKGKVSTAASPNVIVQRDSQGRIIDANYKTTDAILSELKATPKRLASLWAAKHIAIAEIKAAGLSGSGGGSSSSSTTKPARLALSANWSKGDNGLAFWQKTGGLTTISIWDVRAKALKAGKTYLLCSPPAPPLFETMGALHLREFGDPIGLTLPVMISPTEIAVTVPDTVKTDISRCTINGTLLYMK
jgi:hypothetical protein